MLECAVLVSQWRIIFVFIIIIIITKIVVVIVSDVSSVHVYMMKCQILYYELYVQKCRMLVI